MNSTRPWFVPAAVTAVLAVALLLVPVSYERTTGDRVTLALAKAPDPAALVTIAQQMKSALRASGVRVESAGTTVSFVADVPRSSGVPAARAAAAFAAGLEKRGYEATVATAPMREKVTGSVYAFARDVVIKVLHGSLSREPEMRERFRREAEAAARLSHPFICSMVDLGETGDLVYLAMPYYAVGSLADRLARHKTISPAAAASKAGVA